MVFQRFYFSLPLDPWDLFIIYGSLFPIPWLCWKLRVFPTLWRTRKPRTWIKETSITNWTKDRHVGESKKALSEKKLALWEGTSEGHNLRSEVHQFSLAFVDPNDECTFLEFIEHNYGAERRLGMLLMFAGYAMVALVNYFYGTVLSHLAFPSLKKTKQKKDAVDVAIVASGLILILFLFIASQSSLCQHFVKLQNHQMLCMVFAGS